MSLSQFIAPAIQGNTTLANGTIPSYPSVTYDELSFELYFPPGWVESSSYPLASTYLDGNEPGCEGLDLNGGQSYACELSLLLPIGSVHNLTVVLYNANGSTYPLEANNVVITVLTSAQASAIHTSSQVHHNLIFNQTGVCLPPKYLIPWMVVLHSQSGLTSTKIQPSSKANFSECCSLSPSFKNYSTIIFTVPDGKYTYSITPNELLPDSGTVTVAGKDAVVQLYITITSCGSTTAQSSNATTTTAMG